MNLTPSQNFTVKNEDSKPRTAFGDSQSVSSPLFPRQVSTGSQFSLHSSHHAPPHDFEMFSSPPISVDGLKNQPEFPPSAPEDKPYDSCIEGHNSTYPTTDNNNGVAIRPTSPARSLHTYLSASEIGLSAAFSNMALSEWPQSSQLDRSMQPALSQHLPPYSPSQIGQTAGNVTSPSSGHFPSVTQNQYLPRTPVSAEHLPYSPPNPSLDRRVPSHHTTFSAEYSVYAPSNSYAPLPQAPASTYSSTPHGAHSSHPAGSSMSMQFTSPGSQHQYSVTSHPHTPTPMLHAQAPSYSGHMQQQQQYASQQQSYTGPMGHTFTHQSASAPHYPYSPTGVYPQSAQQQTYAPPASQQPYPVVTPQSYGPAPGQAYAPISGYGPVSSRLYSQPMSVQAYAPVSVSMMRDSGRQGHMQSGQGHMQPTHGPHGTHVYQQQHVDPRSVMRRASQGSHTTHPHHHPHLHAHINANASDTHSRRTRDAVVRTKAKFVRDITLPDRASVAPGSSLVKTWRVMNVGVKPWPEGTRVIFIRGDVNFPDKHQFDVPSANPNECVDVNVTLTAPETLGRCMAVFRLADRDNVPFGPRMWVDLISSDGKAAAGDDRSSQPRTEGDRYCDDDHDQDTDPEKRVSGTDTSDITSVVAVDVGLDDISSLPTRGRATAQVLSEPDRLRVVSSEIR